MMKSVGNYADSYQKMGRGTKLVFSYYVCRVVPLIQIGQVKPGQNFSRPSSDQVDLVI